MLGEEHSDTLFSIWNLPELLREHGIHDAPKLYERAITGLANVLGATHPQTIRCEHELSSLMCSEKAAAAAVPLKASIISGESGSSASTLPKRDREVEAQELERVYRARRAGNRR